MKASGKMCKGGKCEGQGWVLGGGAHRWEKLDCCPQATPQLHFYSQWEGDNGWGNSCSCSFVLSFWGKGNGTGKHLLRTAEEQGISSCKVTKAWGLCP